MTPSETLALITLLAPGLPSFHHVQLSHRMFRVSPAHQFMIRQRWRTLHHYGSIYHWRLPCGSRDGYYIDLYADRINYIKCYVRGKQHGNSFTTYANGNRWLQYTYCFGVYSGSYSEWYPSGQLREQCEYVDGKRHGVFEAWRADGQLCGRCVYNRGYLM